MDVLREVLLPRLQGVKMSGGSWMARCPAEGHEDTKASLHISRGTSHPVVLKCLAGETRVITRDGTKTLAELAGGVAELLVPGHGHPVWQKAPISSFGVQRLMRITLRRFGTEKVIHATAEHRWFVQKRNGALSAEVETQALLPGSRLRPITKPRKIQEISSFGVAHGFTYGDGHLIGRGLGTAASFAGPKDDALLSYFPHMKIYEARKAGLPGRVGGREIPSCGPVKRITGLPSFFKERPAITEAPAYLYGWLAGYFAADGSIEGPDGPAVISSASRESLEFVRDVATRLGIVTYPIQTQQRLGCGTEMSTIYKVTLRPLDLPEEFFILHSHRERWAKRTPKTSYEAWRVVSVETTDRIEEVFCATVDGAHAFALEDNILTGNCHAGCDPVDILKGVGLTWETLCAPRDEQSLRGEWTPGGPAVAVYDYTDEAGKLLFQVCRTADKGFSQRVPDVTAKSGFRWRLDGVRRVLYRLPKVIEAVNAGEIIYVCEGEKDVHAVEAAGATATCNPGGAGKWRPEYAEFLRDAVVVVIADRDKPGQAHARQVAASLAGIACTVEIAEAAGEGSDSRPLKDAADHLGAGHTLAELVVTWASDEPGIPDLAPDLHEFLAGVDPPYDWVIENILERGDRLIWTGSEGLGKTVVGRQLAVCAAAGLHPFNGTTARPRRVLWVDCENSARQGRRHFRKLERIAAVQGHRVPDGGMRLIHRPEGIDLTSDEDAAWFLERVHAHQPELLYIGPLYRLHATDISDEVAARRVTAVLDTARVKADCAMIIEGHSPHGGEGMMRPVRPIGSSLFRRWPEFGFGISPANDDSPCKEVCVRAWRGARDERHWPKFLIWGEHDGDWPWIDPDTPRLFGAPQAPDES